MMEKTAGFPLQPRNRRASVTSLIRPGNGSRRPSQAHSETFPMQTAATP